MSPSDYHDGSLCCDHKLARKLLVAWRLNSKVNKRVYFLMKKRLSTEVDQQPPLFPWETEVADYKEDPSGDLTPDRTPEKSPEKIMDETNMGQTGNDKEAPPSAS
jgi:hypothetical protein